MLKKHFIPFYQKMVKKYGPGVVMQEDNAPWHIAKIIYKYIARQGIPQLQWPSQLPDLSPIKNLRKQIKDIIGKIRHKVKTIGIMEQDLKEIWL